MFKEFFATYPNFQVIESPTEKLISTYEGLLPEPILEFWRRYGWGTFMNGYLRFINPANFQEFSDEYIDNNGFETIPFAVTAFGDLLVWENDESGYVNFFDFRHSHTDIVATGKHLKLLFSSKLVYSSIWKRLRAEQYQEAVSRLGIPDYDKCFGYVPLLAFGGNESVDKLDIVDLQVHLGLMAQAVGAL